MEENKQIQQVKKITELVLIDHESITDTINKGILLGEVDPLDVHLALKRLDKIVQGTIGDKGSKETKEAILEEASKHMQEGKSFDYKGAKIVVGATYTYYDFSLTGDILLEAMVSIQKDLNTRIKEREAYLKTIKAVDGIAITKGETVVIEKLPSLEWLDAEEEIVIAPPIKKQKTGVKVTFKKQK